ncbi:TPA: Cro/CI family transcriptional regulator [Klebsiella oxytoca]|uniref:Cro/CI family transcriptional regulator n=1 Tax=Klebsiella oxytoca TaxID=571 RepID=UPI0009408A89|nr:Cro/CI family transcriptional regulator [Klebsiella oxytoca]MBG2596771.1 transcriptional regulator [Klebsiella oxytoca]HCF8092271.1 transcriptional regulator [Klebsiella oxytoca]
MFKNDAINFFGSKSKLALAAGVTRASVSAWGELVPEGRASRLVLASGGRLSYNPKVYDAHRKAKQEGKLNYENHPDD